MLIPLMFSFRRALPAAVGGGGWKPVRQHNAYRQQHPVPGGCVALVFLTLHSGFHATAWAAMDDVAFGHAGCKFFLQAELVSHGMSDADNHDVACFVNETGTPRVESCGIPRCRYTLHHHYSCGQCTV